jgi:hypothetical protein
LKKRYIGIIIINNGFDYVTYYSIKKSLEYIKMFFKDMIEYEFNRMNSIPGFNYYYDNLKDFLDTHADKITTEIYELTSARKVAGIDSTPTKLLKNRYKILQEGVDE